MYLLRCDPDEQAALKIGDGVVTEDEDAASRCPHEPRDGSDQRRLSRAVWPEQPEEAAAACSRLVALLAISGSVLLYLSMFQLFSGGANSGAGSMPTMTMQPHQRTALHAEPVSFYLGLALLVSAFTLSFWRRRRNQCRPPIRLPQPLTTRR